MNDSQKKFAIVGSIAFVLWLNELLPSWIHHSLGFIWVFSLVAYFYAGGWDIYIINKKDIKKFKESD
tara:strand:- start:440 stop:640 length:201 start_codon:yes stop_codon:yes gene_type:complete